MRQVEESNRLEQERISRSRQNDIEVPTDIESPDLSTSEQNVPEIEGSGEHE